jgi:hypothetical protein
VLAPDKTARPGQKKNKYFRDKKKQINFSLIGKKKTGLPPVHIFDKLNLFLNFKLMISNLLKLMLLLLLF